MSSSCKGMPHHTPLCIQLKAGFRELCAWKEWFKIIDFIILCLLEMKPVPKVKDGRTTIQLNYMMMIMKKGSNFITLLCNSSAFTSIWVIPELDLYKISSRCSSRQALLGDTGVVHCNPFWRSCTFWSFATNPNTFKPIIWEMNYW